MTAMAPNLNEPRCDEFKDVQLLTVADFSKCLRISVRQCWRLVKGGQVPAPVKLSNRILRWRRKEISDWLAAGSPRREQWEKRRVAELSSGPEDAGRG